MRPPQAAGAQAASAVALEQGDEPVSPKAYKVQAMLPWGFESKLASGLAVIKIPFMILVALVGMYAEGRLKGMTETSWFRYGNGELLWGTKSGCYAHKLMKSVPDKSLIEFGLVDTVNSTLLRGRLNSDVWKSNASWELDPLDLKKKDTCEIDLNTCHVQGLEHPGYFMGGVDHVISFAGIWLVYKLIFVGIHPIDRLALRLAGNPPPGPDYPEPVMKLLTEPYFQCCTTPMQLLVKFLFYFRYKMMPNTLLGALASMHSLTPQCPRVVYYRMSPRFGNACYYLCLLDLFGLGAAYVYTKKKMGGNLIGKWRYRLWKTGWLISALIFAELAIKAAMMTFGGVGEMIKAILSTFFVVCFKLDFQVKLNLDLLRVMTMLIFFFEGVELAFLVIVILVGRMAPEFLKKFPFLKHEHHHYEELPDKA